MHLWVVAAIALLADLPTGQIVDTVTCAADPTQSYALFLPRAYTADRAFPVILAFDPGGRGRTPVERYQAAADQYGFIVAGSNNSRNNSPDMDSMALPAGLPLRELLEPATMKPYCSAAAW